jgi:hypothetical protein
MHLVVFAGWMFFLQPPLEYQRPTTALVQFLPAEVVAAECEKGGLENEPQVTACGRPGYIIAPDPCAWPTREAYAELLCHEKGHVLRWRHDKAGNTLEPLPPPPPPPPVYQGPEP